MFRPRLVATTIIALAGILVVAGMGLGYAQIEVKHGGGIGIAPTVHTDAGSITATVITPWPATRSWPPMRYGPRVRQSKASDSPGGSR